MKLPEGVEMTEGVKRLYRSREERMIAGVCGGLAEYTNLDPTIVRLLFVGVSILGAAPGMMLAYLAMMVVVPEEPIIEVSSESE
jgi:phage shock protein C